MSEVKWHYMQDDQSVGPITEEQLLHLIETRAIPKTVSIWSQGAESWRPAKEIFSLESLFPPPLPNRSIKDLPVIRSLRAKSVWSELPVHPWRRYFARMLDIAFYGNLGLFIVIFMGAIILPEDSKTSFLGFWSDASSQQIWGAFFVTLVSAFITALFIAYTGTTLGKWIFGIRVYTKDGKLIGYPNALKRELLVWVCGLGFGLPIIALITCVSNYSKLKKNLTTSWDKNLGLDVSYRNNNGYQLAMNICGFIIFFAIIIVAYGL